MKCLLLNVGFSCNNNCIVCSVKEKAQSTRDKTTGEILRELKIMKNRFSEVEFTGGEPTIRKDIVSLIKTAKKHGYNPVSLSTNGRLFSYSKFCEELVEAGLGRVTFSLLGPNKKIHNAISRTPGSFENIVEGIKNISKYPEVRVNVSTVISRLNYKSLNKLGEFILTLGVKNWYILDLIPDSNAKKYYDKLVVKLEILEKELGKLGGLSAKFNEFGFFDFPFCNFGQKMRDKKNIIFINAKQRTDFVDQLGYNAKRISQKNGIFKDAYKINVKICQKCKFQMECGGIWVDYLKLYGEKEIIKIAQKNKCIYEERRKKNRNK